MKHVGCILEFTKQRNEELMKAYKSAVVNCKRINLDDIAETIVKTPCSRFWVSEERANVVCMAIKQGKPILENMRPTKREMFIDIFNRVNNHQEIFKKSSYFESVVHVVNSPAPKFYMRPRCAMEIIYKIKNGFYDKRLKDLAKNYDSIER